MSIKLMSLVWELDLPPGEKLVLLALADQANDAGHQCWPSVSTIAHRSGQGERTVRRAFGELERKGHLTRNHRDGGSTQYHVHPCQIGSPAKSAPLPKTTDTPAKLAAKPSRTTKIPKKDKPSLVARKTRLPADFEPILSTAAEAIVRAWPVGMIERELAQFKDRSRALGQTYDDWQAAFRTWIRNAEKWRQNGGRSGTYPVAGNQPDGLGPTARAALRAFPDAGRTAKAGIA